jgi:apolipoprotein N-acyltransferase
MPVRRNRWTLCAAATALGALNVAAYAPFALYPLALASFTGLFLLWLRAADAREAALLGFAFGLGWFAGGVSWVYVSLHTFGAMPAPLAAAVTLLFCAYLALHPALAGYVSRRFALAPALNWLLLAPAAFTLIEWLRGWLWTGFPWLNPGYSQAPASPLAGYAPILGLHGLTLALLATASALAWLLHTQAWRRPRVLWPGLAALLLLWGGGAALKTVSWTEAAGAPVRVSLIQGNIAQDLKWREDQLRDTLERYLRLVRSSNAQLIVLPETALPLFLNEVPRDYLDALAAQARANGGDLLLGIPERIHGGGYYNSVVSLGSAPPQFYRKDHLVPFGEFIPLRPLLGFIVNHLAIPLQDFARGGAMQQPLAVAGQQVAVNICYEDAFGEEIIRQLPQATLLVNVSNVAWFGRSLAPRQHLQISQMRALESGRPMLRATNTGVTAVIAADGRVEAIAAEFSEAVITREVSGRRGTTPFVRWGNHAALLLCALAIAAALIPGKRRRG